MKRSVFIGSVEHVFQEEVMRKEIVKEGARGFRCFKLMQPLRARRSAGSAAAFGSSVVADLTNRYVITLLLIRAKRFLEHPGTSTDPMA
jgi:hypothetical protein